MQQMKPDGLETVDINFDDTTLPETVRRLRPLVWHDEAAFCVLLGPDASTGVFGCGPTVRDAMADWDGHIKELIKSPAPGNEITRYIKELMNVSVHKIG
jgi:hypothetical protein